MISRREFRRRLWWIVLWYTLAIIVGAAFGLYITEGIFT